MERIPLRPQHEIIPLRNAVRIHRPAATVVPVALDFLEQKLARLEAERRIVESAIEVVRREQRHELFFVR
jgi:hypothetical protein